MVEWVELDPVVQLTLVWEEEEDDDEEEDDEEDEEDDEEEDETESWQSGLG